MLNKILYYFLVLFSFIKHLIIPLCFMIIIVLLIKKKEFSKLKVFIPILVLIMVGSYFVGVYSTVSVDNEKFSIPDRSDYFYYNDEDYSFNGKVYVYDDENFEDNYSDIFSNEQIFDIDVSHIGEFILKNNIGFRNESSDNYTIVYSPLTLCENNFFNGRNNYAGYVIIKDGEKTVFIPYELNFKETLYNDLTFAKIYSNDFKININKFLENTVTQSEYDALRYS